MIFLNLKRLSVVVPLLVGAACNVILKAEPDQCSNDSDCAKFGSNMTCDRDLKVCFPFSQIDGGTGGSGGTDGGGGAPSTCFTNAECLQAGNYICKLETNAAKGQCLKLETTGCEKVSGKDALKDDKPLLLPLLTPLSGPAGIDGAAVERGVELARAEYTKVATTMNVGTPTAVLVCDENKVTPAVLDHFLNLGAKLVLGPSTSDKILAFLPEVKSRKMVMVSPLGDDLRLTQGTVATDVASGYFASPRPNRIHQTKYIATAVETVRSLLETKVGAQFAQAVLAVVGDPSSESAALVAEYKKVLPAGTTYHTFTSDGPGLAAEIAKLSPLPNLIVGVRPEDSFAGLVLSIQNGWPGGQPKPWFLLRDRAPSLITSELRVGNIERVMGIEPYVDPAVVSVKDAFAIAYANANGAEQPRPAAAYGYDAFYMAVHGNWGARYISNPYQVADFKTALEKAFGPPGNQYSVANWNLVSGGLGTIATSDKLDLIGASGMLDVVGGTITANGAIYCWDKADNNYCTHDFVFDASTGAVSGAQDPNCQCP